MRNPRAALPRVAPRASLLAPSIIAPPLPLRPPPAAAPATPARFIHSGFNLLAAIVSAAAIDPAAPARHAPPARPAGRPRPEPLVPKPDRITLYRKVVTFSSIPTGTFVPDYVSIYV